MDVVGHRRFANIHPQLSVASKPIQIAAAVHLVVRGNAKGTRRVPSATTVLHITHHRSTAKYEVTLHGIKDVVAVKIDRHIVVLVAHPTASITTKVAAQWANTKTPTNTAVLATNPRP